MPEKKNLLLGVTGGIAAYKVCEIASYVTKKGRYDGTCRRICCAFNF